MANSQPPDPRHFPSWEAAFAYQIPVVHKLEAQLRKHVDENRSKLRSLVGSRYRELLGTAETIIDMDHRMTLAETHLSDIGRKCNVSALQRLERNHAGFKETENSFAPVASVLGLGEHGAKQRGDREGLGVQAQIKVLMDALAVTSKIVRTPVKTDANKSGDALLAAKLLVLGRLLLKSASRVGNEDKTEILEELRKRLLSLRKKLLGYIERRMLREWIMEGKKNEAEDEEDRRLRLEDERRDMLVNTLSAYALVTSSTPADVLRYFLQTNLSHLTAEFEGRAPTRTEVGGVLHRYGQTISDTKRLFPRLVADSLSQISKVPLLQDPQVTGLYEINLDVYGNWIPEDVRTFTPWVRHDELTVSNVNNALKSWTLEAQKVFVDAVGAGVKAQDDAQVVTEMRANVVSQYFAVCAQSRGPQPFTAIEALRKVFVDRLGQLAQELTKKATLDLHDPGETNANDIWGLVDIDLQTKNGASRLRSSILQRVRGRDSGLHSATNKLDSWVDLFDRLWNATTSMGNSRWDDLDLDDLEDSDDAEDSIQESLNKQDPQHVQILIRAAVSESISKLYRAIETACSQSTTTAARLLRSLREVDERHRYLASRVSGLEVAFDVKALMNELYEKLAERVIVEIWPSFEKDAAVKALHTTTLWDGTPPLPVQPDPQVFRLLLSLQRNMASVGSDLWNGNAAEVVKFNLAQKISELSRSRFADLRDREKSNGTEGDSSEVEQMIDSSKETFRTDAIQLLFDTMYLKQVLGIPSKASSLDDMVDTIIKQAGVDNTAQERLRKSAVDYWKRTCLLFGHLAN